DGGEAVPVEDDDGVDVDIDEEEPVADPADEDAFDGVAVSEFDEPADWVDGQGCGGELGGDGLRERYGRGSGSGCGRGHSRSFRGAGTVSAPGPVRKSRTGMPARWAR